MSDLIALGYGWHDIEDNYQYRWTQDKFSINVLSTDVDSIILTLKCNKIYTDYCLYTSTNDWKTSGKINLVEGVNMVNIPTDKVSEIKFKCSSFIPSDFSPSTDSRTLGVQMCKFTVKSGNSLKELPIKDVKLHTELLIDSSYDLTEKTGYITLKSGWHELEENKQRWTNGNGELLIKTDKYKQAKLCVYSRRNQILKIGLNDFSEKVEKLFTGRNEVYVDIEGVQKINLISDTFSPKDVEPYSKDTRKLGVQLTGLSVMGDIDVRDIPIKNLFFDHDVPQILSFVKKYTFKEENIKTIGGFGDIMVENLTDVEGGKLNLNNQLVFFSHRSGWSFVIDALTKYHNKEGIQFEGFLEKPFIWARKQLIEEGMLPFKQPWVGVLHNPWEFPIDNNEHVTSEDLVKSTIFQKSLGSCKGLYCLSKELMKKVKKEVDVPVNFLYHPTEFPKTKNFSMEEFKENGEKKILEVGSWLRKVNSLFMLEVDKKVWNKVKVIPALLNFEKMVNQIKSERERFKLNVTKKMQDSVKNIPPLSDDEYDDFLTRNIVFVDLYASSANNAIIECMARGTPILVNPLPAIIEYLGRDYPLYFYTIEEASEKVNNLKLIEETHQYLLECPTRKFITKEYFLQEFEKSSIFKNL